MRFNGEIKEPAITGIGRNVTLACEDGHRWESSEVRSQHLNMSNGGSNGEQVATYYLTTTYTPGACPRCSGKPFTIAGKDWRPAFGPKA